MVLLDTACHIACRCPRQNEECVDDEDADPLDAHGNDDGKQNSKKRFHSKDGNAAAARERGVDREQEQAVEEKHPTDENKDVDRSQSRKIGGGNAQDVTDEQRRKF